MKRRNRVIVLVAAVPLLSLGLASPALAGGAPTPCPVPTSTTGIPNSAGHTNLGGSCGVTGTISIASAVTIATNVTSFSLSSSAINSPNPASPFQLLIGSTDANGYYVSEAGPSGGFPNTSGTGPNLPDSLVSMWTIGGASIVGTTCPPGGYAPLPDPSTSAASAEQVLFVSGETSGSHNCATGFSGYTVQPGFDSWDVQGWELSGVDGVPSGTYTGTVQIAAWGV